MAELDPRSTDGAPGQPEHLQARAESRAVVSAEGNHVPSAPAPAPESGPQSASTASDGRAGLDRAEELVDHLADRISSLTSDWGRKLLRLGSRARESAQDFWAEVQDFRQGKKP